LRIIVVFTAWMPILDALLETQITDFKQQKSFTGAVFLLTHQLEIRDVAVLMPDFWCQ